ncbi:unnamed protein product [Calypogeia fissa]
MSAPSSPSGASRWKLHLQAQTWRALMAVGMNLHKMAPPRPPAPTFRRRIPTTISPQPGEIDLLFYTPPDYNQRHSQIRGKKTEKGTKASAAPPATAIDPLQRGYPVVVNFHGGGFTIGQASDDVRWADAVVREVKAIVVSVEYRLAPEHPFPTAVEDGVDAILYLVANADELVIDPLRIAVSGFSAGGNMAFSVPLKLQDVLHNPRPEEEQDRDGFNSIVLTEPAALNQPAAIFYPVAIVAWYPSTDFATNTRRERRLTNIRPDKELPEFFTKLFDASYLPVAEVALSSPYLSPGLAPLQMLRALPDHIIVYTCEWDELLVEAERMRDRLRQEAGKEVVYRKVEGVAHAWDKSPNPLKWDPAIEEVYKEACAALKRAFEVEAGI